MPNILTIAYSVEGSTDVRFLQGVIQRTFEEAALLCDGDIDAFPAIPIPNPKKGNFIENTIEIARQANDMGINVLCIHSDADSGSDDSAFEYKIDPAFRVVHDSLLPICKNLVAIVPVQMSEAWMLADRPVLKNEMGTDRKDADLGIAKKPETIADPKFAIEEAVRKAQVDKPKKSRTITIGDLYQPIGQKIRLNVLDGLPSYRKFKLGVEASSRKLNYLK
jgi:Domain of unknown function (DUF4276)